MANRPDKISRDDFIAFCIKTYDASPTMLEFPEWFELYQEILRLIFWNPDVDTGIAISVRGH
jgi:hypothetical protein